MKILKNGKIPEDMERFTVLCDECDTEFVCTENECSWLSYTKLVVQCPTCGTKLSKTVVED